MFAWFQKKQNSLSKNLRRAKGFRSLPSADFSDFIWNEGHFLRPSLTKSSFDGESLLSLNIGYSLIQTVMPGSSGFKSSFSKDLKNWNDKASADQNRIKAVKAKIRHETLKKLYSDIQNLDHECEEDGVEPASSIAKESVRQILNAVYNKFPDHEYHIYPTKDRAIAFDCNPQKGKGVLILCDSKGGAAYFSTFAGRNSRFRCDCIADFPYEHLWKIFKRLDRKRISAPAPQLPASAAQNKSEAVTNSNNAFVSYAVYKKPSSFFETLELPGGFAFSYKHAQQY